MIGPFNRWDICVTLVGICSCGSSDNAGPIDLSHDGLETQSLSSVILNQDSLLRTPVGIAVIGETIVVSDLNGPPFLHLLNATTGKRIAAVGVMGEGPSEFVGPPHFLPADPSSRSVLRVFDDRLQRIQSFSSDALAGGATTWRVSSVTTFPQSVPFLGVAGLPEGGVVASYLQPESGLILARFDSGGRATRSMGIVEFLDDRLPKHRLTGAYSHFLCPRDDGRKVAVVYRYAGRIDIYGDSTVDFTRAAVPFPFLPFLDKHPVTKLVAFKSGAANVRRAYSGGCWASHERLYALFRGRLHGKKGETTPTRASFIHVFDWAGQLQRILKLDHGAFAIALDANEQFVYSITLPDDPGPISVRRSKI